MFRFIKTKKGFSLVELMIVVVIMAILVAVAVPIFNSVTGSSRAKTCIDNQRSIISTLNNALLSKTVIAAGKTGANEMTFYVVNLEKTSGNTKTQVRGFYKDAAGTTAIGDAGVLKESEIKALFQTAPYCPADNSYIKVDIKASAAGDGTGTIVTSCETGKNLDKDPHVLSLS